jgi:hypothetical protein
MQALCVGASTGGALADPTWAMPPQQNENLRLSVLISEVWPVLAPSDRHDPFIISLEPQFATSFSFLRGPHASMCLTRPHL